MTIKQLIDELSKLDNQDSTVFCSVYSTDDSGDQDHYNIFEVVQYPDGHVQLKTDTFGDL